MLLWVRSGLGHTVSIPTGHRGITTSRGTQYRDLGSFSFGTCGESQGQDRGQGGSYLNPYFVGNVQKLQDYIV